MQFSTVAIVAAIAASAQAGSTVTKVDSTSTLVTISECDTTVTNCPYKSSTAANTTTHGVSTYSAGAAVNGQYAAGFAAVAAGALLAM